MKGIFIFQNGFCLIEVRIPGIYIYIDVEGGR